MLDCLLELVTRLGSGSLRSNKVIKTNLVSCELLNMGAHTYSKIKPQRKDY